MSKVIDVYRSPAQGLALVPPIVTLDPWRCRVFGHRLWCVRAKAFLEKDRAPMRFPSPQVPPSQIGSVWCARCGREWKREDSEE